MYKGGISYTPQVARIINIAGLAVPIILIAYGYMHAIGVIHSDSFMGLGVLTGISAIWLIMAIWQFFIPGKARFLISFRLAAYHLLAALYLLFVTGVATPFIVCWVLLFMAASVYLGRSAALSSAVMFVAVIITDIAMRVPIELTHVLYDLAILVAVLLCSIVVMSISRAQAVDRSELQRSHAQEILQGDRILTIVNNLTDAVLSTDKNGIIRVYNAASLNLLDTNDSLNGHHIDTILPLVDSDGIPVEVSSLARKLTASQIFDNFWYPFDDGERIRLEMTVSPIRKSFQQSTDSDDGHIIILRDITKPKSLEEERDEFVSVVSHELRTPITVVEGSLSNLGMMLDKENVDKSILRNSINLAHKQTLYLAKMANDLSTLSRAERGISDNKEVIELQPLLSSLYETYAPQASEKGLAFDLDISGQLAAVKVSRLYLEELLQNFITNSIKYTKTGSVRLIANQQGERITFAVKDTGIGISKSEQSKIFEKFYRSEDFRTRETGGTGLGLYVVAKLARKLGTEVHLESRLNYGSTFSFVLPIHKPNKDQASQ